ncbi:MAG: hypothetical protein OD918_11545 [Gammaproteobacteria bacterium]
MSMQKHTAKNAATETANASKLSLKFLWSVLRGAYMGDETSSLRLTRDGGMELDMEHFLQREDVKQRIRAAHSLSIALRLVEEEDRKKTEKKNKAKKSAKQRERTVAK